MNYRFYRRFYKTNDVGHLLGYGVEFLWETNASCLYQVYEKIKKLKELALMDDFIFCRLMNMDYWRVDGKPWVYCEVRQNAWDTNLVKTI